MTNTILMELLANDSKAAQVVNKYLETQETIDYYVSKIYNNNDIGNDERKYGMQMIAIYDKSQNTIIDIFKMYYNIDLKKFSIDELQNIVK